MDRLRAAQYFDLSDESWYCYKCGNGFGSARGNYKEGRLIHERDPRGIHPPLIEGEYTFAPDPEWVRIVEFYCLGCGTQIETKYMPPGHPITYDIEIDMLQRRIADGELTIKENRLVYSR